MSAEPVIEVPQGNLQGFRRYFKRDLISGFLVFLIALPLCLGISLACGFPAIAGVFTAIIGGVTATLLSNSELTIKGPAAGLIVIVLGTVQEFGYTGGADAAADFQAYRMALGVGIAAGVIQILFALMKTGRLVDFFPTSVVHGMLASIGVIIIAKQIHLTLGVKPAATSPLGLIAEIPASLIGENPEIALIGVLSLIILFGLPFLKNPIFRKIPAQMLVVLVAVPLGLYFDLDHEHTYSFGGHLFGVGPKFLVDVPNNMFNAITLPDFSGLQTAAGWKWVMMFALIGSLESLLSSKAIDQIDPCHRKTNQDRDLLAVGIGNTLCAAVGGLPMISEIVRSKANIDNGAKTRFANMYHALFLLLFVALIPGLIHEIPLAALAAMLVYTGFRLASPKEFLNVYRVGKEQLFIFVTTIIGVLATDLLVGIGIGIVAKVLVHLVNGAPLLSVLRTDVSIEKEGEETVRVTVRRSAVFSSWLGIRRRIESVSHAERIIVDLSETRLVDHTVMERLHEMQHDHAARNKKFEVVGLESHRSLSDHPTAARKKEAEFNEREPVIVKA